MTLNQVPITDDMRIDLYLSKQYPEYSRSFFSKLIKENRVQVNGSNIKPNYIVKQGDSIAVEFPSPQTKEILPQKIDLDIRYEDEDIIIVNKQSNLVVHPTDHQLTGTLVNGLLYHCATLSDLNGPYRPGIVHRLDKDTTGLIICAKNNRAHQFLAEQFAHHQVLKKYIAIVHGSFQTLDGTVDRNVGRHSKNRKRMAIVSHYGKRAITHYRVLDQNEDFALLDITLETGRTHQIRAHMESIHHPIVGDKTYGHHKEKLTVSRQMLHAYLLGFVHPVTREYMEVVAQPDSEFFEILKKTNLSYFLDS